jgi:uncharacterized protein (TIGR02246 family)
VTREEAARYAEDWAAAWNRRDLEAVLAHFAEDVAFTSPLAQRVAGSPSVRGRAALRAYWRAALERRTSLRFSVVRVLWDPATHELAIVYDRELDGARERAAECLAFDGRGLVIRGEVFYGAIPA